MPDPYAAHRAFIRPASQAPELWRVVVMLVAFELVFALSPLVVIVFLPDQAAVEAFYEGTTAFGTLAQLFSFGVAGLGFLVLLRIIHNRGFWSLMGPPDALRRDLIRVSLAVSLWLLVLELLPPWINPADLADVRDIGVWAALAVVAIPALLVQAGTEEMLFRGYLQQQFACLSNSRWAWMFVPSAMFGALHFWNGNGAAEGVLWAIWAVTLGMACADLTARTGNLGAAIGLHLANNAFALLIVGVQGWPSSGLALFLYPYEDPALYAHGIEALLSPAIIFQMVTMLLSVVIMWLTARIALRR